MFFFNCFFRGSTVAEIDVFYAFIIIIFSFCFIGEFGSFRVIIFFVTVIFKAFPGII